MKRMTAVLVLMSSLLNPVSGAEFVTETLTHDSRERHFLIHDFSDGHETELVLVLVLDTEFSDAGDNHHVSFRKPADPAYSSLP